MSDKKMIGFNSLDLVIVIVLVLCIATVGIRFIRTSDAGRYSETSKYRLTFLITNVSDASRNALVAGDSVFSGINDAYIGKLEGIDTISPAFEFIDNGRGSFEKVYYPDGTKVDITGTIIAEGTTNSDGFFASGSFFLSPGRTFDIYTGHIQVTILITGITEYNT